MNKRISKLQKQILQEFQNQGESEIALETLKNEMVDRYDKHASSIGRSCATLAENGFLERLVDNKTLAVSYKLTELGKTLIENHPN